MNNIILKKIITLVCISSIILTSLIGCGTNKDYKEVSTSEQKTIKKKTISLIGIQDQINSGVKEIFNKLEDEHNIIIDNQIIPGDQYLNILQMKQAANELPDLIEYNIPHIYDVINPDDNLYDLSNEAWVEKLSDPSITQYNGKQYGFPFCENNGYHGIIYNKDVFDKYNLKIPETVEELHNICKKLKSEKIIPILLAADNWVPQIWMASGFARAVGNDEKAKEISNKIFDGQAQFNDYPEFANVVDEFLDLNKKGYFNEDLATLSYDDALIKLNEGKAAMILAESKVVNLNKDTFPDTHLGIFNPPFNSDKNSLLSINPFSAGFVVNKNSKNIEVIKEMFNIISDPEYANLYFIDGYDGFPAFNDGNGGNLQQDVKDLYQNKKEEGKLIQEMNTHWHPIEKLLSDYLWVYYSEALIKGNLDGKEIFDKFQKNVDKFMEENNK